MPSAGPGGLTISVIVSPTRPGAGRQTVLAHPAGGWALGLDPAGRPRLEVGGSELVGSEPLVASCWYRFTATISDAEASLTVDPLLGTPADTVVIASSAGHSDDMLEARENFNMTSRSLGGARNPRVHADLVLVPRENGGAVFSTGSIAYSGALAADVWDSDAARLLGNVFDRFVSGAPVLDPAAGGAGRPGG